MDLDQDSDLHLDSNLNRKITVYRCTDCAPSAADPDQVLAPSLPIPIPHTCTPPPPQALRGAMAEIEAFYGPYNLMLERLVHPAFRWDRSTHELR